MKIAHILLGILLVLAASVVVAKGPADKIIITGPGLSQPIEITDPAVLAPLSFMTFENNFQLVTDAPQNLGEGYELTRYYKYDNGTYMAFDHVHYYADLNNGRGYVFYDGIIGGSSTTDGQWFRVSLDGERTMRQILKQNLPPTPTPVLFPSIELTGHTDSLTVLAWSPDSQLLASSAGWLDSTDNNVRIWKADGTLEATLSGHTMPAVNLAWSPDGQILATASWDNAVRLWHSDGTLLRTLDTVGTPFGLSWSPDGKILAVGSLISTSDNRVQLWKVDDGTLLKTLHTKYSGGKFLNVGWSPDGKYLVGGATDYAEWTADGTAVFTHDSSAYSTPAWGFAWSPDSQMWAIGNESGLVWVYDITGKLITHLTNSQGNVDVMAWSPDGKILAGGNSLWQLEGDTFKYRTAGASGRVSALAWSPDSTMLASSSEAAYIRVSDIDGHQVALLEGHKNRVQTLEWSPDGKLLASGSVDQSVRLWDMTRLLG